MTLQRVTGGFYPNRTTIRRRRHKELRGNINPGVLQWINKTRAGMVKKNQDGPRAQRDDPDDAEIEDTALSSGSRTVNRPQRRKLPPPL
ncbi:MAG TPA: hypothetical protein VGE73_06095 [Pseudolabrys sp.]|jgi:hypothetical protein